MKVIPQLTAFLVLLLFGAHSASLPHCGTGKSSDCSDSKSRPSFQFSVPDELKLKNENPFAYSFVQRGALHTDDGHQYVGETQGGKPHGEGMLVHADGATYEGEFKDGSQHGFGIFTFDGGRYEGYWADDKWDGQGTLTTEDGMVMSGIFGDRGPLKSTSVTVGYPDGSAYEGEWSAGLPAGHPEGEGTWHYANLWDALKDGHLGTSRTGYFYRGDYVGKQKEDLRKEQESLDRMFRVCAWKEGFEPCSSMIIRSDPSLWVTLKYGLFATMPARFGYEGDGGENDTPHGKGTKRYASWWDAVTNGQLRLTVTGYFFDGEYVGERLEDFETRRKQFYRVFFSCGLFWLADEAYGGDVAEAADGQNDRKYVDGMLEACAPMARHPTWLERFKYSALIFFYGHRSLIERRADAYTK